MWIDCRLYEAKQEELVSLLERKTLIFIDESSIQKNEDLWKKMRIDFQLEAFKFPDNKIYGTVDIIPESSRLLIKTLAVSA